MILAKFYTDVRNQNNAELGCGTTRCWNHSWGGLPHWRIQGAWGPGPHIAPKIFSKSCSFQANLRKNTYFEQSLGSGPSWPKSWSRPCHLHWQQDTMHGSYAFSYSIYFFTVGLCLLFLSHRDDLDTQQPDPWFLIFVQTSSFPPTNYTPLRTNVGG